MSTELEFIKKVLMHNDLIPAGHHFDELPVEGFLSELSAKFAITKHEVYKRIAQYSSLGFMDKYDQKFDTSPSVNLSESLIRRRRILPLKKNNGVVIALTPEVLEHKRERGLRLLKEKYQAIEVCLCEDDIFNEFLSKIFVKNEVINDNKFDGLSPNAIVESIIKDSVSSSATDIHLEPTDKDYRIRIRIDGMLQAYASMLKYELALTVIQRIKVLSGLDITENRKPQDGSFAYQIEDSAKQIDIRCATAPTRCGERITLRLLGLNTDSLTIDNLGMSSNIYDCVINNIQQAHGMFLVAGPTGSGKSTTLYAALGLLNKPELNVITVEDPIEYTIAGISQMQVDGGVKLGFSTALRSILRHDPDVLMIGEIRDMETAAIAIRASITGHMVFSSIHANSAVGSVARLMDMGCEPHLLAASVNVCLSQRLVRRLCPLCKTRIKNENQINSIAYSYIGNGCSECKNIGYSGRTAIFEVLDIDEQVRSKISNNSSVSDICSASPCYVNLFDDGLNKVKSGVTSFDELSRIVGKGL